MNRKICFFLMFTLFAFGTFIFSFRSEAQTNESPLIGQQVTNFSLSSTQSRLVSYGPEYYGKVNLIITFFPAAFTPV
jgi:hypothetical protein